MFFLFLPRFLRLLTFLADRTKGRAHDTVLRLSSSVRNALWLNSNWLIDWLSMVLRLRQHNIGYTADGFYRSDDPTNSVKALKEGG